MTALIFSKWDVRFDTYDVRFCSYGLLRPASWQKVRRARVSKLYAGFLRRGLPQFHSHYGLSHDTSSLRNILHDVRSALPLKDNSIDVYQSEDVFEHVPYQSIPAIFEEIYRVLKPGGLFRLSVPDYRNDVYLNRCTRDERGQIVFDPGGGGSYRNGQVLDGGHVWFPTYDSMNALFSQSKFASGGEIDFLHYTASDGTFVLRDIDYSLGYISRTPDNDDRAQNPRRPLSIVVDARKAR